MEGMSISEPSSARGKRLLPVPTALPQSGMMHSGFIDMRLLAMWMHTVAMCCLCFISHKPCWLCQHRTYKALHVYRLTCPREDARSASLAAACVTPDSDALACRSASCPASCRLVCLSVYIASIASCKSPGPKHVSLQMHKLTQHHTQLHHSNWQANGCRLMGAC